MSEDLKTLVRERAARLPETRRSGYEREAVDGLVTDLLGRLEALTEAERKPVTVSSRRHVERMSRKVAELLDTAEENASELLEEARREAAEIVAAARAEAASTRSDAASEAATTRSAADRYAEESRTGTEAELSRLRSEAEREVTELRSTAEREASELKTTAERDASDAIEAAERKAAELTSSAERSATELRSDAEARSQEALAAADAASEAKLEEAEQTARSKVEAAERRRGELDGVVAALEKRRDDAAEILRHVARSLDTTVEELAAPEAGSEAGPKGARAVREAPDEGEREPAGGSRANGEPQQARRRQRSL